MISGIRFINLCVHTCRYYRKDFINKPFPAEHPFHSHIPKFALLPKYDSPEDAKKGVAEQSQQPINSEMPANHSKTFVMEKAKGNGC